MRFFAGLLFGIAIAGGALAWWARGELDCAGRCGAGTSCVAHHCVPAVAHVEPAPASPAKRRRSTRLAGATPEVTLKPGDEKPVAQGDSLGRPERVDLSEPDAHELDQDELDRVFHPAQPRIERCITDALGDAPLESGRVEVGFRVERSGEVRRVRLEAPTLLARRGLARCVREVVLSLRFPASGGSSVVTYPFELK